MDFPRGKEGDATGKGFRTAGRAKLENNLRKPAVSAFGSPGGLGLGGSTGVRNRGKGRPLFRLDPQVRQSALAVEVGHQHSRYRFHGHGFPFVTHLELVIPEVREQASLVIGNLKI